MACSRSRKEIAGSRGGREPGLASGHRWWQSGLEACAQGSPGPNAEEQVLWRLQRGRLGWAWGPGTGRTAGCGPRGRDWALRSEIKGGQRLWPRAGLWAAGPRPCPLPDRWLFLSEEPGLRPQPPRGHLDSHAGTLPGREGRLRRWLSPKGGWTSGGFGPAGRLSGGLSGVSPPALVPVAEMWAQSSGQLGHSQALSPEVL